MNTWDREALMDIRRCVGSEFYRPFGILPVDGQIWKTLVLVKIARLANLHPFLEVGLAQWKFNGFLADDDPVSPCGPSCMRSIPASWLSSTCPVSSIASQGIELMICDALCIACRQL